MVSLFCFWKLQALAAPNRIKRGLLDIVPVTAQDACDYNIGNATYASDPRDCQIYFICDHGWPVASRCPDGTIWTPSGPHDGVCESPDRARNDECGFIYTGIQTGESAQNRKFKTILI